MKLLNVDLENYPIIWQSFAISAILAICVVLYLSAKQKVSIKYAMSSCSMLLVVAIALWNLDHITEFTSKYVTIKTDLSAAKSDLREINRIKEQISIDEIAINSTSESINKKSQDIDSRIKSLKSSIISIDDANYKLNQISKLLMTVILAFSDDRAAYMELREDWMNNNYPYREIAESAFKSAGRSVAELTFNYPVHWSNSINPAALTMEQLKTLYNYFKSSSLKIKSANLEDRIGLMEFIESRKDLPKKEVLAFYLDVIDHDPSLKVAIYAARSFSHLAGFNGTVDLKMFDSWWSENQNKL